jgi:hypothetical protein
MLTERPSCINYHVSGNFHVVNTFIVFWLAQKFYIQGVVSLISALNEQVVHVYGVKLSLNCGY